MLQYFFVKNVNFYFREKDRNLNSILYGNYELCYPCGKDFDCFLREQYKLIANYANNKAKFSTYMLQHIAPQSWFCDFKTNLGNYQLFKYTSNQEGKHK